MDYLRELDDAHRRFVADSLKIAREHPTHLLLARLFTVWIDVWVLRRIAGKLGLPLTRLQSYLLVGIFGRDPGYPYNLVWQEKPVKPEERSAAAKKIADDLLQAMIGAPRRSTSGSPRVGRNDIPLGHDLFDR